LFAADDEQFLAINLHNRNVVNNAWATANGFVEALAAAAERSAKGLAGEEVLVLGLGAVGQHAVHALREMGAQVWVFDTDSLKVQKCAEDYDNIRIAPAPETALSSINYILDATPAREIIEETLIRPSTVISCPGVPHGLTVAAYAKIEGCFIHDILPLGVAVMALKSAFGHTS